MRLSYPVGCHLVQSRTFGLAFSSAWAVQQPVGGQLPGPEGVSPAGEGGILVGVPCERHR